VCYSWPYRLIVRCLLPKIPRAFHNANAERLASTVRSAVPLRLWRTAPGRRRHRRGRCAIDRSLLAAEIREFTESYVAEDNILLAARARAAELGILPIDPGSGAALRLLAGATGARAVVEVGTGTGVSGLWLLRGMRPDGILTTMDIEPEHQRLARLAFTEAGFPSSRTRLITGRALEVLPRLADAAYDLVFIHSEKAEYPQMLTEAQRLLRPGGVVALDNALGSGRVIDPAARDPESVALREVVRELRDSDEWLPALLPLGGGLLCAVKKPV